MCIQIYVYTFLSALTHESIHTFKQCCDVSSSLLIVADGEVKMRPRQQCWRPRVQSKRVTARVYTYRVYIKMLRPLMLCAARLQCYGCVVLL